MVSFGYHSCSIRKRYSRRFGMNNVKPKKYLFWLSICFLQVYILVIWKKRLCLMYCMLVGSTKYVMERFDMFKYQIFHIQLVLSVVT
jgi:hypothetical protein